jgi:hypothetical protein
MVLFRGAFFVFPHPLCVCLLSDHHDICSRSLNLPFSVCCLWRVHKRHCRTCTCALGPLLQVHTTILSSHTSACARLAELAGQAEHLSTVYSGVLFVGYIRFFPTSSDTASPESLPPSDVGFEFEVFTPKALLRGCPHGVHIRYLFDTLVSQDMEIETLCPKRAVWY